MRIAVLTIAYNEASIIRACINNWKSYTDKHVVLVSDTPWNGPGIPGDQTAEVAQLAGATVIKRNWKTEAEQRDWGMAYLYDYDYVFIVDPDELYTKSDQERMIEEISTGEKAAAYRILHMKTYWKDTDHIFHPGDSHKPYIVVDPKRCRYLDKRTPARVDDPAPFIQYAPFLTATMHHFSWVKDDMKVLEKITSYSHQDVIPKDWYIKTWKVWQPGSEMKIRPYGIEQSIAVYSPAPQEIVDLWKACG